MSEAQQWYKARNDMQPTPPRHPAALITTYRYRSKKKKGSGEKEKILLCIMEIGERGCCSQGGLMLRQWWE